MINITYSVITLVGVIASLFLQVRAGLNPISRLALQIVIYIMAAFQFQIQDYYFLGLTYIIVYVGAIAILFQFVIMLIQTDTVKDATEGTPNGSPQTGPNTCGVFGFGYQEKNAKDLQVVDLKILDSKKGGTKKIQSNLSYLGSIEKSEDTNSNFRKFIVLGQILNITAALWATEGAPFLVNGGNIEPAGIFSFFNAAWCTDLFTLTDIQSLGYSIFLAYPIALVILGVILWIVLVGVLCICTS